MKTNLAIVAMRLLMPCDYSDLPCSQENVLEYLLKINVANPKIVLRQYQIESASGTSYIAREYCNIFGFRTKEYMEFQSWPECCDYYKKWQMKYYCGENYYEFLERYGYAESENYINTLKK